MPGTSESSDGADLRHVDVWFFDLDNTLYAADTDLFAQIDGRMARFIADFLKVDLGTARHYQKSYWHSHGTTLSGMMAEHDMPPEPFLEFVHDIEIDMLQPDPKLDAALRGLSGRKFIFTNASLSHAERVLGRLGLAGHFEEIFDIAAANYIPKPKPEPYQQLLNASGAGADAVAMIEDSAKNLVAAHELGMTTIWVQGKAAWSGPAAAPEAEHIHHKTNDLVGFLSAAAVQR